MPAAVYIVDRLRDLSDVDFPSFANGDVVQWNSTAGKFEGAAIDLSGLMPKAGGTFTGTVTIDLSSSGEALVFADSPPADATKALLRLGSALSGGSSSGTYLGLNAPSGYTGNLVDLQVNGSRKFSMGANGTAYFAGLVGIGTATPGYDFEVRGVPRLGHAGNDQTILFLGRSDGGNESITWHIGGGPSLNGTPYVYINHGAGSTGYSRFASSGAPLVPALEIFAVSSQDPFATQVAGTYSFIIKADGKIGIGTTTPGKTLHVNDAAPLRLGIGTDYFDLLHQNSSRWGWYTPSSGYVMLWDTEHARVSVAGVDPVSTLDVNGNLTVGAGYAGASAAPSNGAIIQGAVGIGTSSPNSSALLELMGNAKSLYVTHFVAGDPPELCTVRVGAIASWGILGTTTNQGLLLRTNETDRVVIDTSGQLGIGTYSPGARLDVIGDTASAIVLRLKAAASQSANLQSWQNSGGTELLFVTAAGNLGVGGMSGFGGGVGVIGVGNAATVPSSNPSGGGVLYADSGALKYRSPGGTVTTIAAN